MNFEAVLHYKHQNQARDEKKKLRHASGANITNATTAATTAASAAAATSTEGSNSESEAESTENSPTPSPLQKKVTEVSSSFRASQSAAVGESCEVQESLRLSLRQDGAGHTDGLALLCARGCVLVPVFWGAAVRAEERLLASHRDELIPLNALSCVWVAATAAGPL